MAAVNRGFTVTFISETYTTLREKRNKLLEKRKEDGDLTER